MGDEHKKDDRAQEHDTVSEDTPGQPGAEGGSHSPAADRAPGAPAADDAPLGDTDQHSNA